VLGFWSNTPDLAERRSKTLAELERERRGAAEAMAHCNLSHGSMLLLERAMGAVESDVTDVSDRGDTAKVASRRTLRSGSINAPPNGCPRSVRTQCIARRGRRTAVVAETGEVPGSRDVARTGGAALHGPILAYFAPNPPEASRTGKIVANFDSLAGGKSRGMDVRTYNGFASPRETSMTPILRTIRGLAALVAVAAVAALAPLDAARANHFILPCGDDVCAGAHWVFTGSLNVPRWGHTATLLPDGRVLVAGGVGEAGTLDSAELYDPVSGTWSLTGSMHLPRSGHTATLLSDGRVLVAGGHTAEIYDPASGTWSMTGSMNTAPWFAAATRLQDGRVLIAGGWCCDGTLPSAELYDPGTGSWSMTGSLGIARYGQTMTLLQDGRVLAARGSDDGDLLSALSSAEVYDPSSGAWSAVEDSCCATLMHTATPLPDGTVLVAGGYPAGLAFSELFDPATQTWSRAGDMLTPRYSHAATLLPNGNVLVSGGEYWSLHGYVYPASTEVFSPATGAWAGSADLNNARSLHTATLLLDGTVLVAGGVVVTPDYKSIPLGTAELFGLPVSAVQGD